MADTGAGEVATAAGVATQPPAQVQVPLLTREELKRLRDEAIVARDRVISDFVDTVMREHVRSPASVAEGLRKLAREGDRKDAELAVVGCTIPQQLLNKAITIRSDNAQFWSQLLTRMSQLYSPLLPGCACRVDGYEYRVTVHMTLGTA